MTLHLVSDPDYCGENGVLQVRALQHDLAAAWLAKDWVKLRRLDQCCARVIDKVIAANDDKSANLIAALNDLKSVYASLIKSCQQQAAALAM